MIDLPFDESLVRDRLANRRRRVLEAETQASAAVLVPLFWKEGRLHLLFTKRTDTVSTHKGQISFPGGRREPADESLMHTALRESWEEIGLRPEDVRVLGALDDTATLRDVRITPYVGLIPEDYVFAVQTEEVAYLIEVPVAEFLDPDRLRIEHLPHPDGHTRDVLFYDVGREVIWGATARIVKEWLDAMAE
jgi:8-oxo-dGTP pyrophosphatase MutT (NUDIX family)